MVQHSTPQITLFLKVAEVLLLQKSYKKRFFTKFLSTQFLFIHYTIFKSSRLLFWFFFLKFSSNFWFLILFKYWYENLLLLLDFLKMKTSCSPSKLKFFVVQYCVDQIILFCISFNQKLNLYFSFVFIFSSSISIITHETMTAVVLTLFRIKLETRKFSYNIFRIKLETRRFSYDIFRIKLETRRFSYDKDYCRHYSSLELIKMYPLILFF